MSARERPRQRRYSSPELISAHSQEQSQPFSKGAAKGEALSSAPLSPSGRRRHPRLRMARHTMDTTRGTVDDDHKERRGSLGLFHRVFSRRQRSQNGSGSTADSNNSTDDGDIDPLATDGTQSRRSRRATMDISVTKQPLGTGTRSVGEEAGPLQEAPTRALSSTPSMVGGHRRATMDMGTSSHSKRRTKPVIMSEADYIHMQHRLQHQADDYAKGGDLEKAIEVYVQAFHLAEDHQDSLASKTELMCTILGLHMQAAWTPDPTISEDDAERQRRYHKQNARRYLNRIKPAVLQPSWLTPTTELIEFFVENEAWEVGLILAEHIIKLDGIDAALNIVTVDQLARLHFKVAQKKAKSNRRGEALQHFQSSCKFLQEAGPKKDISIYVQVLNHLATEYASQGQYSLALDALQEQMQYTARGRRPILYCQIAANIYVPLNKLDLALEQLQEASAILDLEADDDYLDEDDDVKQVALELQLLQTKADVLFRLGKMDQSLHVYEGALTAMDHPDAHVNPADKAKILYTMGRLCVRLKRYRKAIEYFTKELEITQATLGYHLSVSRVLHELARLYDEGLGDYRMALIKYKEAFRVEYTVLQQCQLAIPNCENCLAKRRSVKNPNSSEPSRPCPVHFNLQRDVAQQIRETKKCQGRLHFKLGDFQKALQTSIPQNAMGGGAAAARKQASPQESCQ